MEDIWGNVDMRNLDDHKVVSSIKGWHGNILGVLSSKELDVCHYFY